MDKLKLFILVLFLVMDIGYSRVMMSTNSSDSGLVSDGLNRDNQSPYLLPNPKLSAVTCEPMYGFLPCSPNIWGDLFQIVTYQYLLYLGDSYVSQGSQLIFRIVGPGIFGASAFGILDSLTHAILVLASGYSATSETARAGVATGIGFLAGSTVFLLTLLWGTCIIVGRVDISKDLRSFETQAPKPLSFLGTTGVTTDIETRYTARIMLLSIIPFIIAQSPHVFGSSYSGLVATLIALIFSLTLFFSSSFYQVFQPWIQRRRHEYMMRKFVRSLLLEKLLNSDGRPNAVVIKELYLKIDQNHDNFITTSEIKGLILGIQFQEIGLDNEDFVESVLKEFNVPADAHIDQQEFVRGISKWLSDTTELNDKKIRRRCQSKKDRSQETEETQALLTTQETKNAQVVENTFSEFLQAISLVLLGVCILVILASPLSEAVISFSNSANIPSVYVAFIVVPMVVNYRVASSAIKTIKQKIPLSASLTLSEIYTGAFTNNIIGVSIFLIIVYARGLVWDFSAEVLVIVIVCLVMGLYASFIKTFPIWTSFIAYLMYPVSLVLLYFLSDTYVWG